jgi:hypothetical protein
VAALRSCGDVAIEVVRERGTWGLRRRRSLRLRGIGGGTASFSGFKNQPLAKTVTTAARIPSILFIFIANLLLTDL